MVSVLLFTAVEVLLGPFVLKMAVQYAPALRGGIALVTTFLGLLVTTWLTDGLRIEGITTWVLAPLIVWLCVPPRGDPAPDGALQERAGRGARPPGLTRHQSASARSVSASRSATPASPSTALRSCSAERGVSGDQPVDTVTDEDAHAHGIRDRPQVHRDPGGVA